MLWLFVTLLAYFFFALAALVDKYLLVTSPLKPASYVCVIGALGSLVVLLVPFVGFSLPPSANLLMALGSGVFFSVALFWFFEGLRLFETSSVVPAVGGFVPLFTLAFTFLFARGGASFSLPMAESFVLLTAGSVLIALEPSGAITKKSLKLAAMAAVFFALSFVMSKEAYNGQLFWSVLMLTRAGALLVSVWIFLASREVREGFRARPSLPSQSFSLRAPLFFFLLVGGQAMGAMAGILQNYALFLVPFAMTALVYALQGVQYAFLFGLAILLSFLFPRVIQERVSRSILFRKGIALALIGIGLVLLSRITS